MGSLMHEPSHTGPGLSLTQILKADREIFTLMASEFSGSLVGDKGKAPPLDEIFTRLMHDPRVNVHLIAMPRVQPGIGNPSQPKSERTQEGVGSSWWHTQRATAKEAKVQ